MALLMTVVVLLLPTIVSSFSVPGVVSFPSSTTCAPRKFRRPQLYLSSSSADRGSSSLSEQELKEQLTVYLVKRKDVNADAIAQDVKGRIIGGTRGNAVLEFVSGAPVKARSVEKIPDIFDYDELAKYGYGHLVTPIMDGLGGRRAVYALMGLEPPPLLGPPPKKKIPKLVIDRTGENDTARYTGLKMGQIIDDNLMGEALARAQQKSKQGQEGRPTLMEEEYVQPFAGTFLYFIPWYGVCMCMCMCMRVCTVRSFDNSNCSIHTSRASFYSHHHVYWLWYYLLEHSSFFLKHTVTTIDKRNTGPAQVPDWTAEKLDEYAIQQGKAADWARRSKMGAYIQDPSETSDLSIGERTYAIAAAFSVAFAFGRSTSTFLRDVLHVMETTTATEQFQSVLHIPAVLIALTSLGSCLWCGAILAPERNRSRFLWGWKGFLAGPLIILQLQNLDSLITLEEKENETTKNGGNGTGL